MPPEEPLNPRGCLLAIVGGAAVWALIIWLGYEVATGIADVLEDLNNGIR